MGTGFEVLLQGDDAQHLEAVAAAICEEFERLDRALSRFDPSSEISRINREAGMKPVRVDREIFALLDSCLNARKITDGWFDVTATSGGGGFTLDPESHTVTLAGPETSIDPGAIGKGYALDRGAEIMKMYGIESGLLHGGTSSVLAIGEWPVDIRHPNSIEADPVACIALSGRAMSCSAVRHPGYLESDLIDPHTGIALTGDAACVVLADRAVDAEFLSTALLAMGRIMAIDYLRNNSIAPGAAIGWIEDGRELAWLTDEKLK
ncbi:MAG: FAD:protein FMN transferase [Blastocatellales bacterium]